MSLQKVFTLVEIKEGQVDKEGGGGKLGVMSNKFSSRVNPTPVRQQNSNKITYGDSLIFIFFLNRSPLCSRLPFVL